MSILSDVLERARALVFRAREAHEMHEELRFHVQMQTAENVRAGMSAEEARRKALITLGGAERFKEEWRDARGVRWLEVPGRDLRYALRRLRRAPTCSLTIVATLALGIGAAAAVYTLVDAVLRKPLPCPDAGRLVLLQHAAPGFGIGATGQSDGTFAWYRKHSHSFTGMGAYWTVAYTLTDGKQPERIPAAIISPSAFRVLGVPPLLGHWPAPGEEGFGTVMISYGLWQRRYGGDPSIVRRGDQINGGSLRQVVGVMPPGFDFPTSDTDLWFANPITSAKKAHIGVHSMFISAVARLRPGVTPQAAARDIDRMIPGLSAVYADAPAGLIEHARLHGIVVPLKAAILGHVQPLLRLLAGAVAVILLIVWANAATLLLLHAERQQPVIALERALGAATGDVARRWVSEVGLLALAAGLGAWVLAVLAVSARLGFTLGQVPRLEDVRVGASVIGVVALLTLLSAALLLTVGLTRTFRLRRSASPGGTATRATASRERLRIHRTLVAGQIALAAALLVGSALLQRSFSRLAHVDIGFDPDGVVVLDAALPYGPGLYPSYDARASFWVELLARLRAVPGITTAAVVQQGLPLTPIDESTPDAVAAAAPGAAAPGVLDTSAATSAMASSDYIRVMRIRLLAGRTFRSGDLRSGARPIIISASLAHEMFPGGSALNRQIRFLKAEPKNSAAFTVIGVAADVPGERVGDGPSRRLYLPVLNDLHATPDVDPGLPYWPSEMSLVVRTALPPTTVAARTRRIMHSLDPDVPVWGERTLNSIVASSMANVRLITMLFLVATVMALSLAVIGIYSVIAYAVSPRMRELGVRLALGATPRIVTRMVLRDGAPMAITGIVIGLLAAASLTRLLRTVLYQVRPGDPHAFVLMPLLLLGLALLAAYLPARRAGRIDPARVLKAE